MSLSKSLINKNVNKEVLASTFTKVDSLSPMTNCHRCKKFRSRCAGCVIYQEIGATINSLISEVRSFAPNGKPHTQCPLALYKQRGGHYIDYFKFHVHRFKFLTDTQLALVIPILVKDIEDKIKCIDSLVPQSLDSIYQTVSGIRIILAGFKAVGQAAHVDVSFPQISVMHIIRVIVDILGLLENNLSITGIINVLLSFYSLCEPSFAKPEGVEALMISALSMMLPPTFFEVIKRLNLFTTAKLLDDFTMFSQVFNIVIDFIKLCLGRLPDTCSKPLLSLLDALPLGTHYTTINQATKLFKAWEKEKAVILKDSFRELVKECKEKIEQPSVLEWARRSATVKRVISDFDILDKSLKAYESTSRIEPVCFVFEGEPGTMKSVTMNQTIKASKKRAFSYSMKSKQDGKPFFDTYNAEDYFFMDDLGQQGIDQFRCLINWVSCVKFPLDCAIAENKNTKFFCSPVIMFTTNKFMKLHGLCKNDGIDNLEALWRRGYVFDFSEVKPKKGRAHGVIKFKYYDLDTQTWIVGFPPQSDPGIPSTCTANYGDRVKHLQWINHIVSYFEETRKEYQAAQELSDEEVEAINKPYRSDLLVSQNVPARVDDIPRSEIDDLIAQIVTPEVIAQASQMQDFDDPLPDKSMFQLFSELLTSAYSNIEALFSTHVDFQMLAALIQIGVLSLTAICAIKWYNKEELDELQPQVFDSVVAKIKQSVSYTEKSTVVSKIQSQMRFVEIKHGERKIPTIGLLSGHCLVVPAHNSREGQAQVVVYSDPALNSREWDHILMDRIFVDWHNDVAVYRCNVHIATPYQNISHLILSSQKAVYSVLSTPIKSISLSTLKKDGNGFHYVFPREDNNFKNIVSRHECVRYDLSSEGLCGSLLLDPSSGVGGMHVAGGPTGGASVLWSEHVRKQLLDILRQDKSYILPLIIQEDVKENFSGVRFEPTSIRSRSANESNIVPSPFYGVFPVTKQPANLKAFGNATVKVMANKSFQPVEEVETSALQFASDWLDSQTEVYSKVTLKEAIQGIDLVNGVNMTSSCGYGYGKEKSLYIDKENGTLTDAGAESYIRIKDDIVNGLIKPEDIVWVECLKDELRLEEKINKPRTFRCSTWVMQLLAKEYLSKFIQYIISHKETSGIMVGMNPLKDFTSIYQQIDKCPLKWSGDFKKWDGGMLPQVQLMAAQVLTSKFEGSVEDRRIVEFLLYNMPFSLVSIQGSLKQTSHSMPSGHLLTAIMNSVINRMMTAMWYYTLTKANSKEPSLVQFISIKDFVYGDDKLIGIPFSTKYLNMITMGEYFNSLGVGFTKADKTEITEEGEEWNDITFLKRSFVYSPKFKKILPVLSRDTVLTSLSFVDKTKDCDEVLEGKLDAFQREAYLFTDYTELIIQVQARMITVHYPYIFRPESELEYLIKKNDPGYFPQYNLM